MKIYVIQRPNIDESAVSQFLRDEDLTWERTQNSMNGEEIVELSGRVCYLSFGEKQSNRSTSEYIENLIHSGHESVLEHIYWTFLLTGVTRAFSHQLVRHRIGFSFSQLSQQYYNNTNLQFVEPHGIEDKDLQLKWRDIESNISSLYADLIDQLTYIAPETLNNKEKNRWINSAARSILPNCTETKLSVTANARAIRDLLYKRGGIQGDVEMRKFASTLLPQIKKDAPSVFADFSVKTSEDGFPIVVNTRTKKF